MTYLDANVIIRFIEGDPATRDPIRNRLHKVTGLLTSELSRLECRTLPIRTGDAALLAAYNTFFSGTELSLLAINRAVIDHATELRAKYGLKSPDAIHLASAVVFGATTFLTGDTRLANCVEVNVELL